MNSPFASFNLPHEFLTPTPQWWPSLYIYIYIYNIPPDPQFLLLVLVQILNVELIVVGKPYCCL